jgi:hypothetical protein
MVERVELNLDATTRFRDEEGAQLNTFDRQQLKSRLPARRAQTAHHALAATLHITGDNCLGIAFPQLEAAKANDSKRDDQREGTNADDARTRHSSIRQPSRKVGSTRWRQVESQEMPAVNRGGSRTAAEMSRRQVGLPIFAFTMIIVCFLV